MTKKYIRDYFPTQKEELVAIQVQIPLSLKKKVDAARKLDRVNLRVIVESGLRAYLDEKARD